MGVLCFQMKVRSTCVQWTVSNGRPLQPDDIYAARHAVRGCAFSIGSTGAVVETEVMSF